MNALFRWCLLASVAVVSFAQQFSDCDPLDPARCMLPFPNNFWLRRNATTGQTHLQFGLDTFPKTTSGKPIDPAKGGWNDLDGFSPLMPIMTYFGNVSLDNMPPYWNIGVSLDANCPSLLLDTVTGKLLPHFVELDHLSGNASDKVQQALMLWPSERLVSGRRYIVAYRNVKLVEGGWAKSSQAFVALRDNLPTQKYDIEGRRPLFADIFARLSQAGVSVPSLQLAWDFTVASRAEITDRLVFMRDDAFKRTSNGFSYNITEVINFSSGDIAREISGVLYTPQYVDSPQPGARLVLDSQGMPVYQGLGESQFRVRIPRSLAQNGQIGCVLAFGHGLFGSLDEVRSDFIGQYANEHGCVLAAHLWIGLTTFDKEAVAVMIGTDITNFGMVPDRCSQGVVNALLLMSFMKQGQFAKDPAMMFNNQPVVSPDSPSFYTGNSLGGIMGTVYMAMSTQVMRGVVGVMGAPFSLLLPRSVDFTPLHIIIELRYAPGLDTALLFPMFQLLWDRSEPGGYLDAVTSNPLPNTPKKAIILQNALGDKQVSYVGAQQMARSLGCSQFASNLDEPGEEVFGVPKLADNAVGSNCMMQTWDFPGVPPSPRINIPPTYEKDTHGVVRKQKTAKDQMYHFFTTGQILNTCGGPCHGQWVN